MTLALVGATAAGKSALAMALARSRGGVEIVCADSMQVYRGMDIGTAKPTPAERVEVPHHVLDLADPSEEFSVARFQRAARRALEAIRARGHRPVVVGGTGLYVRAVVDGLELPGTWPEIRAEIEAEAVLPGRTAALHERLYRLDPVAAGRMEPGNRRRVVRALEVTLGSGRRFSSFGSGLNAYPPSPVQQVGLSWDMGVLDDRIAGRWAAMVERGLLDEVRALSGRGPELSRTAAQALGYREVLAHLTGEISLAEAGDRAVARTHRFARRQLRWFRRDPRITWVDGSDNPLAGLAARLGD